MASNVPQEYCLAKACSTLAPYETLIPMNVLPLAEQQQNLEQFRHLLFHLQMECGSIHHLFRFFKEEESFKHFDALKEIDPKLMPQLLAREYVLEARKAETPEEARKHLETALQLDPLCPEACLELAALSESAEASMMWYQKSMDATTALLGERRMAELMREFRSKPWQQVETHTYFKAKVNLAEKLFRTGYYDVSILHFQELLALDPTDNLLLRHYLLTALLCEKRLDDAVQLIRQFPDDLSASWYFCRAFLRFMQEGDTRRSRRVLNRAFQRNLWVPIYLLGMEKMPPAQLMTNRKKMKPFREGSRLEAADCVRCVGPAFCEDSGLVYWVWEVLKGMA